MLNKTDASIDEVTATRIRDGLGQYLWKSWSRARYLRDFPLGWSAVNQHNIAYPFQSELEIDEYLSTPNDLMAGNPAGIPENGTKMGGRFDLAERNDKSPVSPSNGAHNR
jgi:hypothetical protein